MEIQPFGFITFLSEDIPREEVFNRVVQDITSSDLFGFPPPRSLFLEQLKGQDGQVSVTGSQGLGSNSWSLCNSELLTGSAFSESFQSGKQLIPRLGQTYFGCQRATSPHAILHLINCC